MKKPVVYMIHGYIASGKTTFAKKLEKKTGAMRFSPDELMVELHGQDPPEESYDDKYYEIIRVFDSVWPDMVKKGVDVILDYGGWTRKKRDHYRKMAEDKGADFVLYKLEVDYETAKKRLKKRNKMDDGSLYIADNTFEILKDEFEPVQSDEEHIVAGNN